MKYGKHWSAGIAAIVTGLALTAPAIAWQPDVHWGLTAYLAYHAGFTPEQAKRIADADQGLDEDHLFSKGNEPMEKHCPSATCLALYILFGSDAEAREASRLTWHNHFASKQEPPAPAQDRKVLPAAESPAGRALAAKDEVELGQALHAYQDSWSHSEIPDTYLKRREKYQWAHPKDKGGFAKSDADKTFLHKELASEMARKTFELLVRSPLNPMRGKPRSSWRKVEANVAACIHATTRSGKRSCFTLENFMQARVDLVDHVDVTDRVWLTGISAGELSQPLAEPAPPDAAPMPKVQLIGDVPPHVAENFGKLLDELANADSKALSDSFATRMNRFSSGSGGEGAPQVNANVDPAAYNRALLEGIFAENLLLDRDSALQSLRDKMLAPDINFHRPRSLAEIITGVDGEATYSVMRVAEDAKIDSRFVGAIRFRNAMNSIVFVPLDAEGFRIIAEPIMLAR